MTKREYPMDLLGERFGRLTVVGEAFYKDGTTVKLYPCICDCGEDKNVVRGRLIRGETKSCGCYRKDCTAKNGTKHGLSKTRLYTIWNSMVGRCHVNGHTSYSTYGGIGITVCSEWRKDFLTFKKWAEENGYCDNLSIDRIQNNGNYTPENCRWVTVEEQALNRSSTIIITINGIEYHSLSAVSRTFNIDRAIIQYRYDIGLREQDLVRPVKKNKHYFTITYRTFGKLYIEEKSFKSKLSAQFFLQEKGYQQQTPMSYKKTFNGWFGDTTATIMKLEEAK